MSYSNSFPQQRPTLNLDFANSGKLDSRLSYSRSSTGTYMSSEKALNSENLISQSADLGSWSDANPPYTTVTSNATTAPDGTTTAAQLTGLTGTNKKAIYYPISAGTGSYTSVCFVKPDGHEYVQLMFGGVTTIYQNYHLSGSGTLGNGTNDAASIDKMGDWYRITITSSSLSSATNYYLVMVDSNTAARYQDSASTSSIYAWGANFSSTNQKVFNSTSGQIHREYSPLLKEASADAPRFEYAADGQSVGTALGLLVESQSTNYNTKSEDIAGWSTPSNMTVSASAMVAPNGTLTADVLTVSDDTVASGHFAYRASSDGTSGQTVAASFFAKTAGVNHIYFYDANTANAGADSVSIFDLNNGTIGGTNAPNCKMIDCGNGWWRCVSVYTLTGAGTSLRFYTTDNGSTTTYIGNGFDGFGLWGVQVEIGVSSESSYISTSGSTVSRASDSCSVALSDVGIANGQSVTLLVEGDYGDPAIGANDRIAATLGKDGSNWVYIANRSGKAGGYIAREGGTNQADNTGTVTTGAFKSAVRVAPNNYGQSINGGAAVTDTSGSVPLFDTLSLGKYWNQAYELNGTLSRVSIYSEPLSDTNLTALTSS